MSSVIRDVRFALRLFIREPGFTLPAVLTMALGIGATTAVFTVVDAVLLRSLAYNDPDRLVAILRAPGGAGPVSPADFLDYRRDARTFEALAAAQAWGGTLGAQADTVHAMAERVSGLRVSANMFSLLGVPPLIGRTLTDRDDQPGRENVVVLSHTLWQRRFAGAGSVVGRVISIDGTPFEVIGVMPAAFRFAPFWQTRAEMWAPLSLAARVDDRAGRSLRVFGRLKDGISVAQSQAELSTIAARLQRLHPQTNTGVGVSVQPLLDRVVSGIRPTLLALMGIVTCVLLIACANVTNAVLARTSSRRKEMGVRIAIGASRGQVIRQLLIESLMLACAGQLVGVMLAWWGITSLLELLPPASLPRQQEVMLDLRVLIVASGATLLAGTLTGLVPAWQAVSGGLTGPLDGGGVRTTESRGRKRLRSFVIAGEVMLSVVLLGCAGLMLRTMSKLQDVDTGFTVDRIAVADISLAGTPHARPGARHAMFLQVRDRLSAMPGVRSVSAINHLPLSGDVWTLGYTIEGRPEPPPAERWAAVYRIVLPGYFTTMGLPLLAGRDFTGEDRGSDAHVAVINQAMADRHWPGESPLGRRIFLPGMSAVKAPITIIGVAANARQSDWTSAPGEEVYLAFAQRASEFGLTGMTFVLRTVVDPQAIASAIAREANLLDPGLAVSESSTLEAVARDELWRERLTTRLSALFGILALVLAAIGIYAVVSYSVSRRTREIGVRLALGASPASVQRLTLTEALRPVLWGALAGVLSAAAAAQWIRTLLYDVSAADPIALGAALGVLLAFAAAAAWIPARRASRLDPVAALRRE